MKRWSFDPWELLISIAWCVLCPPVAIYAGWQVARDNLQRRARARLERSRATH